MRYQLMIAAAVAAAGLTAPAHAQDLSGFRIEARGAWERAETTATVANPEDDEDEEGDEFLSGSDHDTGVAYGVELGYDLKVTPGFLVGAYAGADFSDAQMCGELIEDDLACTEIGRSFTLGARAGIPLGASSLIFVKGGYSDSKFNAAYDADVTDNDDDEPGEIAEFSEKRGGYHVGTGVEVGLRSGIYAKLEYLYTDFGSSSYLLDEEEDVGLDVDSKRHQVFAGFGLRF